MSSLPNVTTRHVFLSIAGLAAIVALSGCRETVSCVDNPSPVCPDAAGPGMDAAVDAFVRPDANLDAPGLDAWEPDSPPPPDAWAPDSGTDAGPCSRCPSSTPACDDDGVTCVECTNDTHCVGHPSGPACDTETNECVPCNVGGDCTAPLAACLDHVCRRCDERSDCTTATDLPACIANDCVQCEIRTDCADNAGLPACFGNACVQCEANTDCPTATASRCDLGAHLCTTCTVGDDTTCSHIAGANRCVAGTCRQCTVATEATDCGPNSCNPATNTCTMTPRNMTGQCLPCVADSECMTGFTCAAVNPARGVTGTFCLPIRAGAFCTRPYAEVNSATSASGATVTYCRHSATTCEAFLQHRTTGDGACTGAGGTDAACGAVGVADGLCRLSGLGNRCTHRCNGLGTNDDCGSTNCVADPVDVGQNMCGL